MAFMFETRFPLMPIRYGAEPGSYINRHASPKKRFDGTPLEFWS